MLRTGLTARASRFLLPSPFSNTLVDFHLSRGVKLSMLKDGEIGYAVMQHTYELLGRAERRESTPQIDCSDCTPQNLVAS